MSAMSPKERMLSAILRERVDRLPVATYNFHPFGEFAQEPAYLPMLKALCQAKNVGILCKAPVEHRGGKEGRLKIERRAQGEAVLTITQLDTPKGRLSMVHKKPKDQPGYCVEPLIKDDTDLEKFLSLPNEVSFRDLTRAKEIYEKLSDKGLVYVHYDDPFYSVARWFDFEDFAIRCIRQFSLIKQLVERELERIKVELKLMLDQAKGYDLLFYTVGPEIATPPLLPPRIFETLVTPYDRELVGMIREAGHLCSIHCHGKLKAVFDQFFEIGANVLEPMEPPPQGDISLEEALDKAEGRICLMGYIQDQELYTLSPKEIRERIKAIFCLTQRRTGYIMTPTATPYMLPPPERFVRNYLEFIRAADTLC